MIFSERKQDWELGKFTSVSVQANNTQGGGSLPAQARRRSSQSRQTEEGGNGIVWKVRFSKLGIQIALLSRVDAEIFQNMNLWLNR